MPPTIRERLPWTRGHPSVPLLGQDFVFAAADYPSLRDMGVVHEEVSLSEALLAARRTYHLADQVAGLPTMEVRFALAWNGAADARELLYRFVEGFERPVPINDVVNTATAHRVGDVGAAWSWSGQPDPDVVTFVRWNVWVAISGSGGSGRVLGTASGIDGALRILDTTDRYADDPDVVRLDPAASPLLRRRARLPLLIREATGERAFFVTNQGSVNRLPDAPGHYYRAGLAEGPADITVFVLGRGILPRRGRITIAVN